MKLRTMGEEEAAGVADEWEATTAGGTAGCHRAGQPAARAGRPAMDPAQEGRGLTATVLEAVQLQRVREVLVWELGVAAARVRPSRSWGTNPEIKDAGVSFAMRWSAWGPQL